MEFCLTTGNCPRIIDHITSKPVGPPDTNPSTFTLRATGNLSAPRRIYCNVSKNWNIFNTAALPLSRHRGWNNGWEPGYTSFVTPSATSNICRWLLNWLPTIYQIIFLLKEGIGKNWWACCFQEQRTNLKLGSAADFSSAAGVFFFPVWQWLLLPISDREAGWTATG